MKAMKQSSYLLIILFTLSLFGSINRAAGQAPRSNQPEENIRVYPNPIDQKGIIELELDQHSPTVIELFNLAGKRVKLVAELKLNAGLHRIEFEAGELKEGFYFCKVSTDHWIKTKRILIKR